MARLIPTGPKVTINSALEDVKELRQIYETAPANHDSMVDMARDLEGTVRSTGIHAAGVVISRDPLETVVPLQLPRLQRAESVAGLAVRAGAPGRAWACSSSTSSASRT